MISIYLCLFDTKLFDEALFGQADINQQVHMARKQAVVLPESYTLLGNPCISKNLRNQGSCGNCWATATAATIGMRRCMKFGDDKQISI